MQWYEALNLVPKLSTLLRIDYLPQVLISYVEETMLAKLLLKSCWKCLCPHCLKSVPCSYHFSYRSSSLPWFVWRFSNNVKAMGKYKGRMESRAITFLSYMDSHYIKHPNVLRKINLLDSDGVNLSDLGDNTFYTFRQHFMMSSNIYWVVLVLAFS